MKSVLDIAYLWCNKNITDTMQYGIVFHWSLKKNW